MKKKFLSLMMAAAVVATTSVSAFAEVRGNVTYPNSANVTDQDDTGTTSDVTITGNVTDDKGNMPTTSFKVTVPTAASFTVNKSGTLLGANLEVKNEGPQEIEVYAKSFSRVNEGTGLINTVKESDITGDEEGSPRFTKAHVALKLEGQNFGGTQQSKDSVAYLSAVDGERGVYKTNTLDDEAEGDGIKLLALKAGDTNPTTATIRLNGSAGKGTVGNNAITDKFQLTLKIKKVTKS